MDKNKRIETSLIGDREVPLGFGRLALRVGNDNADEKEHQRRAGENPDEVEMPLRRVHQPLQDADDGKLWDAEGQHAGRVAQHDPEDGAGDLVLVQQKYVYTVPIIDGGDGKADGEPR